MHLVHERRDAESCGGLSTGAAAVVSEPVLARLGSQVGECGIDPRLVWLAGFLTGNTLGDEPLGLALPVSGRETARQAPPS